MEEEERKIKSKHNEIAHSQEVKELKNHVVYLDKLIEMKDKELKQKQN